MAAPRPDPELARQLFFEGAAVVVLDVPEGTEFGIDYSAWAVGPRFRGVKMVPPGLHFVHCSAAGPGGRDAGPRSGRFLSLRRREVRALRWDPACEAVRPEPPERGEALRDSLRELDPFLGPYPYETLKKWVSLSNFISEAAAEELQPESGQICAFAEVLPEAAGRHTRDRAGQCRPPLGSECRSYAEGLARLPRMRPRAGTQIRFSELPRQAFPDGATPEEITRHSMDLSYALQRVMEQRYPGRPLGLLGEHRPGEMALLCKDTAPGGSLCLFPGAPRGLFSAGQKFVGFLAAVGAVPAAWRRLRSELRGAAAISVLCDQREYLREWLELSGEV